MAELEIKDIKSLTKALADFFKNGDHIKEIEMGSVMEDVSMYVNYEEIDKNRNKDFKKFDKYVLELMKIYEPNSKNPYYDFYTYISDIKKFYKFINMIDKKIEENWPAISKVLKKEMSELGEFDENIMRYVVKEFHREQAKYNSITCIDCICLFTHTICTDSSPIESMYCAYLDKIKDK